MSQQLTELLVRYDLHSHTTASDGELTPEELVERAAEMGINFLAITDHDTCAALPIAQQYIIESHLPSKVDHWRRNLNIMGEYGNPCGGIKL
ncbi:Histidinol phosphatase and related hydrolases of the PHP family [Moellerella wisconsensis]|nr:Histidinol phosphatase and related hydrolases of the PHP family [Moellerella wisconsensis]